jgi:hypothetical protein
MSINGKAALVTGAGQGIERAGFGFHDRPGSNVIDGGLVCR